ncbi:MAG: glycosyl hydrolase family 18 protein [Oscillospiraceae bacterium]|nr:glycosyl hydrolase family 18 protein [Oscillospiraceae bacterium]
MTRISLHSNNDGTYDVIVNYERDSAEFAADFFSRDNAKQIWNSLSAYMREKAGNAAVRTVKIAVGGVIVAAVPFAGLFGGLSAGKFNMSYIYFGTHAQQVSYAMNAKNSLNTVAPSYFDINKDGSLKLNLVNTGLTASMREQGIKVVPFLSNHWDRQAGINFLANYESMAAELANLIETYGFDGINVDIENVTHTERDLHTEFVASLRAKIPPHKEVSVAVAANPKGWTTGWHGSYDYAALGRQADYLMLMTYDEHYQGGTPGPVASYGFVEDSIVYALKEVPKEKIVIGMAFFGRIWSDSGFSGEGLSMVTAEKLIADYRASVEYDTHTKSMVARFTVQGDSPVNKIGSKPLTPGSYTLWYENDRTIAEKLELVHKYDLKGAGSWALGQELPTIWNSYHAALNGTAIPDISANIAINTPPADTTVSSSASRTSADTTPSSAPIAEIEPESESESETQELEQQIAEQADEIILFDESVTAVVSDDTPVWDGTGEGAGIIGILGRAAVITIIGGAGVFAVIRYRNELGFVRRENLQ